MGNSDDPHLEDVDIQFHASCVYMCNSLCWGLTKAKLEKNTMKHFFLKPMMMAIGMLLSLCVNADEWGVEIHGIKYDLKTASKTAKVADNYGYTGVADIPSSVEYNGIEYSVIEIGPGAFSNNTNTGLTSVIIPNSVNVIGFEAFKWCGNLTSLDLPNSVTTIGTDAFFMCRGITSLTIPRSVNSIKKSFTHSDFVSIRVDENNTHYDSRNNCNAIIETGTNTLIKGCQNTIIPDNVTTIGSEAFVGCKSLSSITIPNSVTSIESSAFSGCKNLTSIIIPKNVKSIGWQAFCGCENLMTVISEVREPFSFSSQAFEGIGKGGSLFDGCKLGVPYGTKEAYIAAGWTEDVFKGGIVEAPYNPASDNYLTITDTEVCKGRQITLPVNMNNTESITALQFEVSLPEGVAISKCQLTERKGEDHTVSYKKLPNGNYQVTAISLSKANFGGTAGALLNLTLDVDEGVTADDYTIGLTNIELTTVNTQAVNPADVSATLTVSDVKIADVDGNGKVSITDAVAIVSYILGDGMDGFVAAAADVDGNGKITITDAVAVVDVILSGSASAKMRVEMDEEMLDPQ